MHLKRSLMLLSLALMLAMGVPVWAQGDGTEEPSDQADDHLGGATEFARADEPTDVILMLDWTPNANHLGFYAAQALGYYDDANLSVEFQEPSDIQVEALVANGVADFGVSFQEFATYAIAGGTPVVSLAAIIQHNTSGFVSIADMHPISTPADMAGLRYGGFGQPDLENAILNTLLACDGAEPDSVEYVNVGYVDLIQLMQQDRIDLAWIFYGVQGVQAELSGVDLDAVMMMDYFDCVPDYYTPILITGPDMVEQQPDVVAAFVQATARGYAYAIDHPDEAANMLLEAVPELDSDLIHAGAEWLAPEFQSDAPRWGEQQASVWQGYTDFLVDNGILESGIDAGAAFTNAFLPGTVPAESD
ncbi:ABC transporter substrate-binding protein [Aggregatilinea lenta]|uniref:ABC transporter substrate-binding protein n=1 Tax=Aggregatilinea lenta TaxID=913108 RepID=UPI000E5B5CB3|nr:ABC transporter substrate-binding protein [Aggregatilinea lenta]